MYCLVNKGQTSVKSNTIKKERSVKTQQQKAALTKLSNSEWGFHIQNLTVQEMI
jgi:hypothetical protein